MSAPRYTRAECVACGSWHNRYSDGTFRPHGPRAQPCFGSRRTPEEIDGFILPPIADEQLAMMRECWSKGDWRPVEVEFGVTMPQYDLHGSTPEEELADLVNDVRHWLDTLVELASRATQSHRV